MGASEPTFHRWGRRFAAMGVAEVRRMRQLEDEDHKLKQLAAGLTLDNAMLQDVLRRRW